MEDPIPRLAGWLKAWIARPEVQDLRELVRHRAKLVAVRSGCKCQVHAVVATCGIPVRMSGLLGQAGNQLLDRLALPTAFQARVSSLRRLLTTLDAQIELLSGMVLARLGRWAAVEAVQRVGTRTRLGQVRDRVPVGSMRASAAARWQGRGRRCSLAATPPTSRLHAIRPGYLTHREAGEPYSVTVGRMDATRSVL